MALDRERGSTATPESDGRVESGTGVVGILIAFLAVIGLIIAAIVAWAAFTGDGDGEGLNVGVTASDIHSNPEEYYGVSVMVSGEVNEVIGPNAFTIGGEGFLGGDELLIITADGVPLPEGLDRDADEALAEDDIVQVTGTVSEFVLTDIEEDAGIDLEEVVFEEFDRQPTLVAETVNLTPRLSELPTGAISIEQINENEDLFDGLEVTVNGETGNVWGPGAFMLRRGAGQDAPVTITAEEQILVVGGSDVVPSNIVEGTPLDVTGVVRLIDEDGEEQAIEEEFGFDIEDGLLDAWADEPVIIVSAVTAGPTEATIEIERMMTDVLAYIGTQVTTGGVVDDVIHPQAFVLTDDSDTAAVNLEVLVVGGSDVINETIVDQAFVQVTGTPYFFDNDFEAEYGSDFGFLWEDEAFEDYDENTIVIVADSIEVVR